MHAIQLQDIDLNLLVALEALLAERSVTKAAARLRLTPSAMSHTLNRLRTTLGDELLVRTRGGMITTHRGEQLLGPLRRALRDLTELVRGSGSFDPSTARREISLATTDYVEVVLLPPLLERIWASAPGVTLRVKPLKQSDVAAPLENGTFDVAVGAKFDEAPGLQQQALFTEEMVCVCRKDHPVVKKELDLETYLGLGHVLVSLRGGSQSGVDARLAEMGRKRRIALIVPHFLAGPLIVARSDLLLTAPARLIEQVGEALSLRILPPPLAVPGFSVRQIWHQRFQEEPAHLWLREQIFEASAAMHPPGAKRRRRAG